MTEDILPYEVKRLIFDYVDLETLKQLRLTSHSWAAVGTELLLLPTLFIKSYSVDIPRLTSIGNSPTVSQHAATTVKSVVFQSLDWDPVILRKILTSRHEARVIWETADFVPTLEEQAALSELDAMIKQRGEDQILRRYSEDSLARALELLPRVNKIKVVCENLFKSRLLRKVFEEFSLETHRRSEAQPLEVLSAAQDAGLKIEHFSHDQLLPEFFEWHASTLSGMAASMQHLESLHLTITNISGVFEPDENNMISSLPQLHDLSIKFETLRTIPLDFLPQSPMPNLHTLSLYSILLEPDKFFPFLKRQAETLKRLSISSAEIPPGQGSWSSCLVRIKENVGPRLDKFQVSRCKDHSFEVTLYFPLKPPDIPPHDFGRYVYLVPDHQNYVYFFSHFQRLK